MVMLLNLENLISIVIGFPCSGEKKKHTHEWAKITATAIMKLSYPETRIKYHGVLM